MEKKGPLLFGHRGCSHAAPENTLASFKTLLEYKVPGVELDVHMCKSGELVIIHDFNTRRVSGIDTVVENTNYDDLTKIDVGSHFSREFKGERIPTLNEVFKLLQDKVYYDIEIKHEDIKENPLENKVIEMIREFGLSERVLISSFNPFAVKRTKKLAADIPTAVIYSHSKAIPFILRRGFGKYIAKPDILKPGKSQVTKRLVNKNKPIVTWVVDDAEYAKKLLKDGVIGIISNEPEKLMEKISFTHNFFNSFNKSLKP